MQATLPSVEAVVDGGSMGPEPSQQYLDSLDLLDNVTRQCIHVSKDYAGIPSPSPAHFYASVLFTVMLTKCVSLIMLAPHSPWADKKIEHWDYGSMTGMARTMIELRVAFFYLCTEECTEEEWRFRWNLFNLHDCMTRLRMFDALGAEERVFECHEQADKLRERLTSSPFFATIDSKRTKKLLHGQTAYLFPLEVIAERAGVDLGTFRWLYVLFSSHVHALPMSFYGLGGRVPEASRVVPIAIEESQSSICMTLAATLLVRSRDEFETLFSGLKPQADPPMEEGEELPDDIPVGVELEIALTDELIGRMEWDDGVELVTSYVDRRSETTVFEHARDREGNQGWRNVDPFYWSFSLNGGPVTRAMLEEAIASPHLYRVDHNRREIMVKTQDNNLGGHRMAGVEQHDAPVSEPGPST